MANKYQKILDYFKTHDPKIHAAMENLDFDEWIMPRKEESGETYFESLCRAIVGQQLSIKAAQSIYKRFETLLKNKITPDQILKIEDQKFRDIGMSWAKAKYVKNLAQMVKTKEVVLDNLHEIDDEAVVNELIKVKGIGKWTGEMFLIFTLRRPNVFSHGDLGLKRGIEKVYKLKNPSVKQIERIVKKWEPYKSYGSIALWYSLDPKNNL